MGIFRAPRSKRPGERRIPGKYAEIRSSAGWFFKFQATWKPRKTHRKISSGTFHPVVGNSACEFKRSPCGSRKHAAFASLGAGTSSAPRPVEVTDIIKITNVLVATDFEHEFIAPDALQAAGAFRQV
jgi:hypothetical protein